MAKYKETDQAKLFEYYQDSGDQLDEGLKSLDRLIPSSQTTHYTHGIHPYVAKFMPQYPLLFIRLLSKPNDTVLDPMCGSGTTLIEAVLNERNALGIDIDPLARLVSKVATTPISYKKNENLRNWYENISKKPKKSLLEKYDLNKVPNHEIWFRDDILQTIFYLKEEIDKIEEKDSRDIARVALSRIVKEVSNADPRDAMPEINHEHPVNEEADVWQSFTNSLYKTLEKIDGFSNRYKNRKITAKIIGDDARKMNLENNDVDLIVTSPPYAYAMDYGRIHKLSMFTTLDLSAEELRELSKDYVGTDRVSVKEELQMASELSFAKPFIEKLASKDKRRALSLQKYLMDMYKITQEGARVLKKEGHFVYVIGNSTLAKEEFSSANALKKMGELIGLQVQKTFDRSYYMRSMGKKRAAHSSVTKSDVFIIFKK